MSRSEANPPISLHRFAVATALATFVLLGMGGLVTSHGVGMAVPDWPNTYGYNMFFFPVSRWVGGIFYEHTHRLAASAVGLLTSILALWLYGRSARPVLRWAGLALFIVGAATSLAAPRHLADGVVSLVVGLVAFSASFVWPGCEPSPKWLRRLGLAAFLGVVLQGVLGGLRVVLFQDQLGIFHATLAQGFFVLVSAVALATSDWWWHRPEQPRTLPILAWLVTGTTLLVLAQLVLGATMRHQHAGLAIPDFPLAYGKLWPATDAGAVTQYNQHRLEVLAENPITGLQIVLQLTHRLVAAAILCGVGLCAWLSHRRAAVGFARFSLVWLGLILLQVLLGAATIWSNKAADIATAHVLVGALSLAVGSLLSIVLLRDLRIARKGSLVPVDAPAPSFGARPLPASGLE